MKIIEALKKIKDLKKKAEDIKVLAKTHCADMECETPVYADQKRQVESWCQAYSDIIKEILELKYRVQKTNIETQVTIELGDRHVTKSIAEWIHRRKELASLEENFWRALTDKGHKDNQYQLTPSSPVTIVKRRLYFDAVERDKKIELYRSEPSKIDAVMETINALTDLN